MLEYTVIRLVSPSDLEHYNMNTIIKNCFPDNNPYDIISNIVQTMNDVYIAINEHNVYGIITIKKKGSPIGYPTDLSKRHSSYSNMLYYACTIEKHRNKGIMTSIITKIITDYSLEGKKVLHLEVENTNTNALTLYLKLGFNIHCILSDRDGNVSNLLTRKLKSKSKTQHDGTKKRHKSHAITNLQTVPQQQTVPQHQTVHQHQHQTVSQQKTVPQTVHQHQTVHQQQTVHQHQTVSQQKTVRSQKHIPTFQELNTKINQHKKITLQEIPYLIQYMRTYVEQLQHFSSHQLYKEILPIFENNIDTVYNYVIDWSFSSQGKSQIRAKNLILKTHHDTIQLYNRIIQHLESDPYSELLQEYIIRYIDIMQKYLNSLEKFELQFLQSPTSFHINTNLQISKHIYVNLINETIRSYNFSKLNEIAIHLMKRIITGEIS